MGETIYGMELDGDTLWFRMYESTGKVYIVSWEYPKNTSEELQKDLADITGTFTVAE